MVQLVRLVNIRSKARRELLQLHMADVGLDHPQTQRPAFNVGTVFGRTPQKAPSFRLVRPARLSSGSRPARGRHRGKHYASDSAFLRPLDEIHEWRHPLLKLGRYSAKSTKVTGWATAVAQPFYGKTPGVAHREGQPRRSRSASEGAGKPLPLSCSNPESCGSWGWVFYGKTVLSAAAPLGVLP